MSDEWFIFEYFLKAICGVENRLFPVKYFLDIRKCWVIRDGEGDWGVGFIFIMIMFL